MRHGLGNEGSHQASGLSNLLRGHGSGQSVKRVGDVLEALSSGEAEPFEGLNLILGNTQTVPVGGAQTPLRAAFPLLGGLAEPPDGFRVVFWDAFPSS